MNIVLNSAFLAISICSAAGYLISANESEENQNSVLALNLIKAVATGLAAYMAGRLGIDGGIWGYRQFKIRNLKFASDIEWGLNYLSKRELGWNGNFFALLTGEGKYAIRISLAIEQLAQARILTEENRAALLVKDGEMAKTISSAMINLHREGLLTKDNRTILLENEGEFAGDFSLAIKNSHEDNSESQELCSLFQKPFSLPSSSKFKTRYS